MMKTGGSREHLRRAKKEISMKITSTVSSRTGSITEQHKTMDQHTSQEFFCIYDCDGQSTTRERVDPLKMGCQRNQQDTFQSPILFTAR